MKQNNKTGQNKRIPLPKVASSQCFACGPSNPIGLKMDFFLEADAVVSEVNLAPDHVGWEHLAHGGILSTLLDEIMGWTVMAFVRRFVVTKKMEVSFFRPVSIKEKILAKGWIQEEFPGGGCRVQSMLYDEKNRRLTGAWADMAYLSEKRVQAIPEGFRQETLNVFAQMEAIFKKREKVS